VDKNRNKILFVVFLILIAALFAMGIYLAIKYEYFQTAISLIDKGMSTGLFIALMVILPLVGFPISIFLIMGGIKFGIFYFILIWVLVLPFHTLIGYYLARWVRNPLERFLSDKMGYRIPKIPENGNAIYSFLFLAIPGIPYAGKNYMLPLAGVPFRYCVLMSCIVQGALGIPFIVLGKSAAEMNLTLFYITLFFFVVGYIVLGWLKNKYRDKVPEP